LISYPQRLIFKHRGGSVLVDSNLLLLWFVGVFRRKLIGTYKRLNTFSSEDFDLLAEFLKSFRKIVTTPNILTEVSNLSGALTDHIKPHYFASFTSSLDLLQEEYVRTTEAAANPLFLRLGLTDAVIATVAARPILVITTDFELYYRLQGLGVDVVNFNHQRRFSA
jgi:hypothetical protein